MIRAPPRTTLTYTLVPYTTLFRSILSTVCAPPSAGAGRSSFRLPPHRPPSRAGTSPAWSQPSCGSSHPDPAGRSRRAMDADDPQPGSEAFTDAARWLCSYGREDTPTPAEGTRHGLRLRAMAPRHHQLIDPQRLRAQPLPARQTPDRKSGV